MTLGPVSQALEAELVQEVRRQGIVIWLDKDSNYTSFVDHLIEQHKSGSLPFPVVGFRGSFLEVLFALEAYGSSFEKHSLIVHMPGFNEDSIRQTPVLELYEAGKCLRKGLDTLVRQAATGRAAPDKVEAFLRTKPTLEQADGWLEQCGSTGAIELESLLATSGPMLVVEALSAKGPSTLANWVGTKQEAQTLRNYLHKWTGMDDHWFAFAAISNQSSPLDAVLEALGAWILCVEYVQDLRREPHLQQLKALKLLSKPLETECLKLVGQLRKNSPAAYEQLADDTELLLEGELESMLPDDLGDIDTFREEENRVLKGAVEALKAGDWTKPAEWAKARQDDKSFWLQRDPVRRRAWNLVAQAASFGAILSRHPRPLEGVTNFEAAIKAYSASGALVDRLHRCFEQDWLRGLDTQMPHFGALQEVLGNLRKRHRYWVDQLARDFTNLCRQQGFLPPPDLQQRTLFEQVVQPLMVGGEKLAVFLIDAFRYEMATELVEDLRSTGGGASVDLKARFAELPTITSVGMNALAPVVHDGKLTVAGKLEGFKTGEFTVRMPADRVRAIGNRTSAKSALQLGLAEICESTPDALKRKLKDKQIVVVCSTEIDDAGEANVGLLSFEGLLRQIKAAWHHLQTAGIKQAVFTADHGFLLQDSTTNRRPFGKKSDPDARYVLDDYERGETGLVPISLAKLGYEGLGGYLLVPEDTSVFETARSGAGFVHGGNSLEERLIPVLTVSRKRAESASMGEYLVEAEPMKDALGFQRVRVRVKELRPILGFVGARSVDLDIRVPARKEIQAVIKEASGAGSIKSGRISTPISEEWTEVFFTLLGPNDERVRLEVRHPDNIEKVSPCVLDAWFPVSGGASIASSAPAPESGSNWAESIVEESVRAVFLHIEKHGSITESEVTTLLGNPRATRKFALNFDTYLAKIPFGIRCESNDGGKRYVREGDK